MVNAIRRATDRAVKAAWSMELGDWGLQTRDCAQARAAFMQAFDEGAARERVQPKMALVAQVCGQE